MHTHTHNQKDKKKTTTTTKTKKLKLLLLSSLQKNTRALSGHDEQIQAKQSKAKQGR